MCTSLKVRGGGDRTCCSGYHPREIVMPSLAISRRRHSVFGLSVRDHIPKGLRARYLTNRLCVNFDKFTIHVQRVGDEDKR